MTPGADLFVVCKQCGSEVSPYVTECPYCGTRLRRRAPKLPRMQEPSTSGRARAGISTLLRRSKTPSGARAHSPRASRSASVPSASRWSAGGRPWATITLVAVSAGLVIARHAEPRLYTEAVVFGPLHGDWWRLFTYEFAYLSGIYAFVAILAIALFGWLLESRHGPFVVLALFFGAGASGALLASAVASFPFVAGGNAAALALLAAWAVPDLLASRSDAYYEGDLLAAAAIAALLLALPFALIPSEASWVAGLTGAAIGLLAGVGLATIDDPAS
jgi:membrane associated rhomboid family serine protease